MSLHHQILHEILETVDKDLLDVSMDPYRKKFILLASFYFLICFRASLQGSNGFMLMVKGLLEHADHRKHEQHGKFKHVFIPLLGKFKGEQREQWYLLVITGQTVQEFKPCFYTSRVIHLLCAEGKSDGLVIYNNNNFAKYT
eukprot:4557070-Ditylum_brightwellii.AAC.2